MAGLKTVHTPELLGLYSNSNRFTQPKGTLPRLSNLYLIQRGALHTVPGSKWVSSWDGLAPHSTLQAPLVYIHWYSPSANSSPDLYMASVSAPSVSPHNFVLALDNQNSVVHLYDVSGMTFLTLAIQAIALPPSHPGTDPLPNMIQYLDYLIAAFGLTQPPNIFPTYTQLTGAIGSGDTSIEVGNTLPFPNTGYLLIGTEAIQYTGISATEFTGLTRGVRGTVAAAHAANAGVILASSSGPVIAEPWGPIFNTFDPSATYSGWPGTPNASTASGSVAVNIGSVIFVVDGAGTSWLFRAQNSGVTGWGTGYYGPTFFADSLEYNDGAVSSGSPNFTSAIGLFTAAMVGLPIEIDGAGASGANLTTTVLAYVSSTAITLAVNAGTTVTAAHYKITGNGATGFLAKDYNALPGTGAGQGSGTVVWVNIGQAALPPPGAAFVFQHLNYLFLWGVGSNYGPDGITGPDALWQSNFGVPTSFDAANATFVGKGDGTTAQGGAVYSLSEAGIAATPQLVLFKDASTYSFLNAFPNAALVEVSGGLGCIAPNTIQFIGGYGVMRLSYAGVTLFDGQLEHTTEYTDAIRAYLWPAVTGSQPDIVPIDFSNIDKCVSTQTKNPPAYMFFAPLIGGAGYATRGFGYDFGLKQWWIMDLPFEIGSAAFLPQSLVALAQGYQALVGGSVDGVVRRILFTDDDWDGAPINWSGQLPDYGFPGTPVYVRRTNIYITTDGLSGTPSLTSIIFNGIRRTGRAFAQLLRLPQSLISSLDVGETVLSGNLTISGKGQVLIEGTDAQTSDKPTARVGL